MFSLLTQYILFHTAATAPAEVKNSSAAQALMETADAHAGRDPHYAAELRAAAVVALTAAC